MKPTEKSESKKRTLRKKPIVKMKKEHVALVANEVKFARLLSSNEKKTRDRALKSMKKWIMICFNRDYNFKEDDFMRLWKGLFYAVWMSDKPLVQEDLCEEIASVLDIFPSQKFDDAMKFVSAGFRTLASNWYGIDQHRQDKFHMLVRRYLRGSLRCLRRCSWDLTRCTEYADMLAGGDGLFALSTPAHARNATSLMLHITDIFLEELSKVCQGDIPEPSVAAVLAPFVRYTCAGAHRALCVACRRMLTALLQQSELGIKYQARVDAWKRMGCPEGGPEALELVSDDEDDDAAHSDDADDEPSAALDPRAGRVDCVLVPLPTAPDLMARGLRSAASLASGPAARRRAAILAQRFESVARDKWPLRLNTEGIQPRNGPVWDPGTATENAKALAEFEKQAVIASDELAIRGLRRKQRKRMLAKIRDNPEMINALPHATNGEWHVESLKPEDERSGDATQKRAKAKKRKTDHNDKENGKKPKITKHEGAKNDTETQIVTNGDVKMNNKNNHSNKNKIKHENVQKQSKHKIDKNINKILGFDITNKDTSVKVNGNTKSVKNKIIQNEIADDHKITKKNKIKNNDIVNKNLEKQVNGDIEVKSKHKNTNTKAENKCMQKKLNNNIQKVEARKEENTKGKKKMMRNAHNVTPKRVKFVLKNNSMQRHMDYYKSIRQSPNIPFDESKKPEKTNLKPFTPSPINPFLKKKLKLKL